MELLIYLLYSLRFFAFRPWFTAPVALVFTVLVFNKRFGAGSRVLFGLAALSWWAFTAIEAITPVQANIRIDLFILGWIYMGTLVAGAVAAIRGWPRGGGRAGD